MGQTWNYVSRNLGMHLRAPRSPLGKVEKWGGEGGGGSGEDREETLVRLDRPGFVKSAQVWS